MSRRVPLFVWQGENPRTNTEREILWRTLSKVREIEEELDRTMMEEDPYLFREALDHIRRGRVWAWAIIMVAIVLAILWGGVR